VNNLVICLWLFSGALGIWRLAYHASSEPLKIKRLLSLSHVFKEGITYNKSTL